MDMNHGASWGGSSGDNRYGGTGYGSGWGSQPDKKPTIPTVVIILAVLCPLIALTALAGFFALGGLDAAPIQNPDPPLSEEPQESLAALTKPDLERQRSALPSRPPDTSEEAAEAAAARPKSPTLEDFYAIQSNSDSDSADEGGIGGGEAAPEARNANAENINESKNEGETDGDGDEAPAKPLSKESVVQVFRQRENIKKVRSCYRKALEKNPGAGGKAVFKFVINNSGHVQEISVQESGPSLRDAQMELRNPEMEECIRLNFQDLKFPKFQTSDPDGTATIIYPMIFAATDDEDAADEF